MGFYSAIECNLPCPIIGFHMILGVDLEMRSVGVERRNWGFGVEDPVLWLSSGLMCKEIVFQAIRPREQTISIQRV